MGYCSAGKVVAVGKDVKDMNVGDRVAGMGTHSSHDVMTAEYYRLPDGVSTKQGALLIMCAISLHGVRVARIELGESVVVFGLGLVGQLAVSLAKLAGGMPVIAVDIDDFRLKVAGERGADMCINPEKTKSLVEDIRNSCVEDGANVVLESTGIPAVYPTAVQLACTAGRVISLGSPRGTVEMSFFEDVHLREITVVGALQPLVPERDNIYYRWTKERERNLALKLLNERKLLVEDLITHVAEPEQCQEMYAMLADDPQAVLGVLFKWK